MHLTGENGNFLSNFADKMENSAVKPPQELAETAE